MPFRNFIPFAALALVSCAETLPPAVVTAANSPRAAVADVFVQVAVANFLATNCRDIGIQRAFRSVSQAVDVGQSQLEKAGFDKAALDSAREAEVAAPPEPRARAAIQYLEDRGAVPGDFASACAVGVQEIAKRTFVGTLLRQT